MYMYMYVHVNTYFFIIVVHVHVCIRLINSDITCISDFWPIMYIIILSCIVYFRILTESTCTCTVHKLYMYMYDMC